MVQAVAPRPAASAPKKKAGFSVFMLFVLNKTGSIEDIEPDAVLQQFSLSMTGLRGPFAWATEWQAMRTVTRAFLLDFSFARGGAAMRMLRGRDWILNSTRQHMPMPFTAGRKCLAQLLSMAPLAVSPGEIKEWRATGHGGRHFLVTAARAFEARSALLDELGRWAGLRRQALSLAVSTGGGKMAAGYSEEVGDAIYADTSCTLLALETARGYSTRALDGAQRHELHASSR
ncbi:hypothetical protein T492DRAFT_865311 [Pavlovales sp. CCMP2436]|nr:hypothetical protein T492DRAFT_865311 [Pavlovales sp. CCMP2436]